jgi:2OG-Fe(II) oxygenase superfamily
MMRIEAISFSYDKEFLRSKQMKQIFVHDTALSPEVLAGVQKHFAEQVRWQFGWPQGLNDPFSHWNIDFLGAPLKSQLNVEADLFAKPELQAVADVWRELKAGPMRGHYLLRCYANAHTYGVEGYPHTDIVDATQVDNYTAVVYLNPVWKKEWAGELVLFNSSGDTLCAVLPRPGRAALIPGDIVHAARGVSRQCPAVRVCIAFKSRLPTALELAADAGAEFGKTTQLYLDPQTNRVVYFSAEGDVPSRCFVYTGKGQVVERVFSPHSLQRVTHLGDLPSGMYAQNSWHYRLDAHSQPLMYEPDNGLSRV